MDGDLSLPEADWASKAAVYNVTLDFKSKQRPHFDIITLMQTVVLGRHGLLKDGTRLAATNNSNFFLFAQILGISVPLPIAATTIHVADVARCYVAALRKSVAGNDSYLIASETPESIVFDDFLLVIREEYPDAVKSGRYPMNGSTMSLPVKMDCSKALKVFPIELLGFEE